jgi:MYXO-CTERM domain-containing protein
MVARSGVRRHVELVRPPSSQLAPRTLLVTGGIPRNIIGPMRSHLGSHRGSGRGQPHGPRRFASAATRLLGPVAAALFAAAPASAAENVQTFPTPFNGSHPRLAVAADGSLHMVFFSGGGVSHAKMTGTSWGAKTDIPNSSNVSKAKYNKPALALDPQSVPHVVWGPTAHWTSAADHTKGVWYWNGSATSTLFDDYAEYVALGIMPSAKKLFAGAVLFLPGDNEGHGVGWAEVGATTLGPITRFPNAPSGSKYVSFCRGSGESLRLVWRFRYVHTSLYASGAFGPVTNLATSPGSAEIPACAVDAAGDAHVVWVMWKDLGSGNWAPVDLRYARQSGSGWAPSTDGLVLRAFGPKPSGGTVAVTPQGDVLVVWTEGGTVWTARSKGGGGATAAATAVTNARDADDTNQPVVPIVHLDGKLHGVFERDDGKLVRAVFGEATVTPADAGPADGPGPKPDGAGAEAGVADAPAGDAASPDVAAQDARADAAPASPSVPAAAEGDEGGCGCRVVAAPRLAPIAAAAALALLSAVRMRRRHRRV